MDAMEDKTYKQAWEELLSKAKQELRDEVDKRLTRIAGNTVASVVEDMPEGREKERMRRILLMGKVALAFELAQKRNPLLWLMALKQDEIDELSNFVIELYMEGNGAGTGTND
jgi:flagellar motor switch/type III secretory pathway protein FliN